MYTLIPTIINKICVKKIMFLEVNQSCNAGLQSEFLKHSAYLLCESELFSGVRLKEG